MVHKCMTYRPKWFLKKHGHFSKFPAIFSFIFTLFHIIHITTISALDNNKKKSMHKENDYYFRQNFDVPLFQLRVNVLTTRRSIPSSAKIAIAFSAQTALRQRHLFYA